MTPTPEHIKNKIAERRMIFEMMEASLALSIQKGKHSLTKGCSCMACADKRKRLLRKTESKWRYRL